MADVKRVFYVKYLAHNIYVDILKTRSDIRLDKLENDSADDVATPVLAGAHAYQIGSARDELAKKYHADRDLLRRTQSLLIVSTNGAGYDTVNLKACTDAGVLVLNQAGGNKEAVAEHALAMMLSLTKRIIETDRAMRRDKDLDRNIFIGHDLRNKTVGIIGIGHIGRRMAQLCGVLFNNTVLAYDPYLAADEIAARGANKVELDELLQRADYVTVHCPRSAETFGMFGAAQFAAMKPSAYFINTARGGIHDEAALEAALRAGRIAGAGLDVFLKEPPDPAHPLLNMDNVVASPHIAGMTVETMTEMCEATALQWLTIFDGGVPPRLVNPEAWPRYSERFIELLGFRPADLP